MRPRIVRHCYASIGVHNRSRIPGAGFVRQLLAGRPDQHRSWAFAAPPVHPGRSTESLLNVYNECQSAGYEYNCTYSTSGYGSKPHFFLAGGIRGNGADGKLTVSGINCTIFGELGSTSSAYKGNFQFTNCMINMPISTVQKIVNITATNSIISNPATSNFMSGGAVYGDDNIIQGVPYLQGAFGDEYPLIWTDEITGLETTYGLYRGKTWKHNGGVYLQSSYNTVMYENCDMPPQYWVARASTPDRYLLKDCIMRHSSGNEWNFRVYGYDTYADHSTWKFLNISNPDDNNNVKRVTNNNTLWNTFNFFRRAKITVQSDGVLLSGVSISVKDNAGQSYSGTTDLNGYVEIDIIEQMTYIQPSDGLNTTWTGEFDTLYSDFEFTISKDGYETVELYLETPSEIESLSLSLKKAVPVMVGTDGRSAVKVNPKNIGANRDKIIIT